MVSDVESARSCLQVYIDIFADGPTRVVRFADTEAAAVMATGVVEMCHRILQLQSRLEETDRRFVALRGSPTMDQLDLFGRAIQKRGRESAGVGLEGGAGQAASSCLPDAGDADVRRLSSGGEPWWASGGAAPAANTDTQPATSIERAATAAGWRAASLSQGPGGSRCVARPLSDATARAVSLMLAGDVMVTVLAMRGLPQGMKSCNPMVRLRIGAQVQQTSVRWATYTPTWDEALPFHAVRHPLHVAAGAVCFGWADDPFYLNL